MTHTRKVPRIVPVLDILDGQVVRAVAGRRSEYRPIQSPLIPETSEPIRIAKALLDQTKAAEIYIADLDAILGRVSIANAVRSLLDALPVPCWVDVGVRELRTAEQLHSWTKASVIWASETVNLKLLQDHVRKSEACWSTSLFSIDLHEGRLLGDWQSWGARHDRDLQTVAQQAVALGFHRLIVLDLGKVGVAQGPGTLPLIRQLSQEFPDTEIVAGGGVRHWDDVHALGQAGASAVLVSSALHDGSLFPNSR